MNLCNNDHEEVCYESRTCPVCDVLEELEEKDAEIGDLEGQVENMTDELQNTV